LLDSPRALGKKHQLVRGRVVTVALGSGQLSCEGREKKRSSGYKGFGRPGGLGVCNFGERSLQGKKITQKAKKST